MRILIKGGHLIDPANKKNGQFDLIINKGKIEAVEPEGSIADISSGKIIQPVCSIDLSSQINTNEIYNFNFFSKIKTDILLAFTYLNR